MSPTRALALTLTLTLPSVACTSSTAPADPAARPVAAGSSAATIEPAKTPSAEAPTEVEAATATGGDAAKPESSARHYCLCYRGTRGAGEEPVTVCRATQDQCAKLQARARVGGNGIVPRSVMRACQEVRADHPGDVLATRDRWSASTKVAGGWLSTGECLLAPGTPGEIAAESPEAEEAAALAAEAAAERFYEGERIGALAIGMRDAALIQAVGKPTRRSGRAFVEYSGGYEDRWEWAGRGLTVTMASDGERGAQHALAVMIEAPSELRTARGVGLGEAADRVRKLYADVKSPDSDEEVADEVFVAGSIYGGLFFMFEEGKVKTIILGPSAE
ncbi:MAG: hypothetical protein R3B09_17805 [Nannocystaceae bacterium]